jgi:hypothetical protein
MGATAPPTITRVSEGPSAEFVQLKRPTKVSSLPNGNLQCSEKLRFPGITRPGQHVQRWGGVQAMAADVHTSLALATPFPLSLYYPIVDTVFCAGGASVSPMAGAGG